MFEDTIIAPISGLGTAAVAVLRISGPDAWEIASKVFTPWPIQVEPLKARYGQFVHGDEGLVLPFREGHSFTGEHAVEMFVHGSPVSVSMLIDACARCGARLAKPGEFTQRAFMNGKIDLTQAEAIRDTIEAETDHQFRAASRARQGAMKHAVRDLIQQILSIRATVEATVDFSEEIGDLDRDKASHSVRAILGRLDSLISRADSARLLRKGMYIAIIGAPNCGKSSLLNALLHSERAIVSETAGTTRDFLEEKVSFKGFPVILADTAGLRDSSDPIEKIGISRGQNLANQADLVWFLYDGSAGLSEAERVAYASIDRPKWLIANKCDLGPPVSEHTMTISALEGTGLDQLIDQVIQQFNSAGSEPGPNERQTALLREAHDALSECQLHLNFDTPPDLISVLLTDAYSYLVEVTGDQIQENMIDKIFRDFCLGK